MTRLQQTIEVAKWEFNRFVKWRQQFIGLAVMFVFGVGGGMIGNAIKGSKSKEAVVAVVGAENLGFAVPVAPSVRWDSSQVWNAAGARAAIETGDLDGALIVASRSDATVLVPKRAAWTETLGTALNAARQEAAIAKLVITPEQRAAFFAPINVSTNYLTEGSAAVAKSTRIFAFGILGLGLLMLFSGFGTMFIGITSEKTQRVTEQIVAMVPPQAWMDGKIIGLATAAIAGSLVFSAGFAIIALALPKLLGKSSLTIPPIVSDYGTLALIVLITLLGVAMWFSVMAAIAATIDDPNSSTRSMLLFLPMLPSGLAIMLLSKAETTIAQVFSMFPLTAMSVLPMRLMLTSVPWWEVVIALAGLVLAVWMFRLLAGKIFSAAILMHGKEPGVRELWRWMRA
jgi:ABC-2 type transport system permease protein